MWQILGLGAAALLGFAGYKYIKNKDEYSNNVKIAITALFNEDDKAVILPTAKLQPSIVDNLIKTYLSNNRQEIEATAAMLNTRGYLRTGNSFKQRASQLQSQGK